MYSDEEYTIVEAPFDLDLMQLAGYAGKHLSPSKQLLSQVLKLGYRVLAIPYEFLEHASNECCCLYEIELHSSRESLLRQTSSAVKEQPRLLTREQVH